MSVEFTFETEGVEELQRALDRLPYLMDMHVHRALQRVGEDMHMDARRMCPVRTGRLRDSIYHDVQHWILVLGAKAPYAIFIELGTRYIQPYYFLTEAINLNLPKLHHTLDWAIDHALKIAEELGE